MLLKQPGHAAPQTASIMRTVMELSLKNRLRQYQLVQADVSCDAMGLLDGR
jgi:hypothetical protein